MRYMESLRGRMGRVNGGHRAGLMTANSTGSAAMWNSVGKAVIVLMMLILAGCNEDNAFFDTTGTGTDTETSAESITMLASSPQLGSSGSDSVT
ncbi:MAG: hypothetical protein AB7Q01_00555, partial [Gammaproteobacteria bacterium]